MRKTGIRVLACTLAATMLFSISGCSRSENQEINNEEITVKIGVILNFSGEEALESQQLYEAAVLAVEEINESGGVLTEGYRLELVQKDDGGVALNSAAAYYQLAEEGVCAVIGTNNDEGMTTIAGASGNVNVPIITPVITDNSIVDAADFNFQACFSNEYMAEAVSYFAKHTLEIKKTAVAYDPSSPYAVSCYEDFMAAALAEGLEIVWVQEVNMQESEELEAFWEGVEASGADAVYVPTEVEIFAEQILPSAHEEGYSGVFLGTDQYADITDGTEGCKIYVPCSMALDNTRKDVQNFLQSFITRFDYKENELYGSIRSSYESVYYIRDAIEAGYLATAVSVALKLPFLEGSTPIGDYEIGAYGNTVKSVDFVVIQDEHKEYYGSVFE